MIVLSGFACLVSNMPVALQWLSQADPLRHCLIVIRTSFPKGGSVSAHPFELGRLALLGTAALTVAALRVR